MSARTHPDCISNRLQLDSESGLDDALSDWRGAQLCECMGLAGQGGEPDVGVAHRINHRTEAGLGVHFTYIETTEKFVSHEALRPGGGALIFNFFPQ